MDPALTGVVLQYGLPGVVIIAEAFVIRMLYADNQALHKQKDEVQEARRLDAKENMDKVVQPLDSISQTVKLMYDKLKLGKEG